MNLYLSDKFLQKINHKSFELHRLKGFFIHQFSIMTKSSIIIVLALAGLFSNCKKDIPNPNNPTPTIPTGATAMKASPQRTGDATKGYAYLLEGDYLNSGIPLNTYKTFFPSNSDDLGRTGDNKGIAYDYTASTTATGVKIVSQNCLTCHAAKLNGKLVIGLGNNIMDNTQDRGSILPFLEGAIKLQYGANSSEWKAYEPYGKALKAIAPSVITKTIGENPADKIFAVLAGYRKAEDLSWLDVPQFKLPVDVIPTDVPAWWLLKKKNALYYNALGQGDFARLIMASSLLTMKDSSEATKIDLRFPDVVAYLQSIQAPKYPYAIDANLVTQGQKLYSDHCAKCHGTSSDYPNYLIDLQTIGTDAALANLYTTYPDYHNWYNKSWFAKGKYAAQLTPQKGYIAPPLDGVWATAPYFHNGAVPTLEDVLNSNQRPKVWKRTQTDNSDYDQNKMGWKYTIPSAKNNDILIYDTALTGRGNGGHTFGDALTPDQRKALLEYLKTL